MKAVYSLMLLLMFSFNGVFAQNQSKTEEITIKTEIACDHCNYCESCRPNIENALFSLSGVKQVKLDIEAQTIKVVYFTKKTTPEEINNAILAIGYPANGIQPTTAALDKLDGCCKRR